MKEIKQEKDWKISPKLKIETVTISILNPFNDWDGVKENDFTPFTTIHQRHSLFIVMYFS